MGLNLREYAVGQDFTGAISTPPNHRCGGFVAGCFDA
jgi:hypothetical protein